jgi:Holliday junction resolvase RusA-like endonuclease
MYSFLSNFAPRSVNADPKRKAAYYKALVASFQQYNQSASQINSDLYGFAYYFHREKTGLDADNLSKPIWDALNTVVYPDDKLIRFRSSAVFDLQANGIEVLDLSNMPDEILDDFLQMIDDEKEHILYVELGKFNFNLFQFGYENR